MKLFVDDQRRFLEIKNLVNPYPIERDFVGNNAKHKRLIAIIDNGVLKLQQLRLPLGFGSYVAMAAELFNTNLLRGMKK